MKPYSLVNSALIRGIFKGFVSRGKKLYSEKYLQEELNFHIDMFVETGHDRNYLNSTVKEIKHQAPKIKNTDKYMVKIPWIPTVGSKIRKQL